MCYGLSVCGDIGQNMTVMITEDIEQRSNVKITCESKENAKQLEQM
jgi:putative methionine-R-sulfoxide reductase with GAF domain